MTIPFSTTSASIAVLKTKSAAALGIFTKTVKDLEGLNATTQKEFDLRAAKIEALREECTQLEDVKSQNVRVIEKINSILA